MLLELAQSNSTRSVPVAHHRTHRIGQRLGVGVIP
jgi:hypothetical protein